VPKRPGLTAKLTGHPRVLGIKEDVVLEAVREFMAERPFGPDRLRLLSDELAASLGDAPQSIEADRKRLQGEQKKIEEALRRQALRLEEHDDPDHPVIRLATARIEELSAQGDSVAAALAELEGQRPEGPSPQEIEAMLSGVPDLSEILAEAESEELIELLDAFDVEISYDKPSSKLELSAALSSDLIEKAPAERSRNSGIAGAGFEPATFGL
jgi:site-specific DNA recombinase